MNLRTYYALEHTLGTGGLNTFLDISLVDKCWFRYNQGKLKQSVAMLVEEAKSPLSEEVSEH